MCVGVCLCECVCLCVFVCTCVPVFTCSVDMLACLVLRGQALLLDGIWGGELTVCVCVRACVCLCVCAHDNISFIHKEEHDFYDLEDFEFRFRAVQNQFLLKTIVRDTTSDVYHILDFNLFSLP